MTTTDTTTDTRKATILACLRKWIAQRPGLEFGNYGDVSAYRSEMRSITTDRHHAEAMLRQIELHDSITADHIIEAAKQSFSGRLRITEPTPGRFVVDYCTGQYWPTEYRRAVCAVAAGALWTWMRDTSMPAPSGDLYPLGGDDGRVRHVSAGDWLRTKFKREFGRTIANRWFN